MTLIYFVATNDQQPDDVQRCLISGWRLSTDCTARVSTEKGSSDVVRPLQIAAVRCQYYSAAHSPFLSISCILCTYIWCIWRKTASKIPNFNKADRNLTQNRLYNLFYCIFLTLTYRTFVILSECSRTGPPFGAVHSYRFPFVFVPDNQREYLILQNHN